MAKTRKKPQKPPTDSPLSASAKVIGLISKLRRDQPRNIVTMALCDWAEDALKKLSVAKKESSE